MASSTLGQISTGGMWALSPITATSSAMPSSAGRGFLNYGRILSDEGEAPVPESRPGADAMRELVLADLSRTFRVQDVDVTGFTLERDAKRTRVHLSAPQLDAYITDIEDSAYQAIGIEPTWKSGVSLTAVHVMEEAAMATPGMDVVVDGTTIRREPPPG